MDAATLRDWLVSNEAPEINARSLEGGIYLLEAIRHGERHTLTRDGGRASVQFRSLSSIRDFVGALCPGPVQVHLIHHSPYEEMIGLPGRAPLYQES